MNPILGNNITKYLLFIFIVYIFLIIEKGETNTLGQLNEKEYSTASLFLNINKVNYDLMLINSGQAPSTNIFNVKEGYRNQFFGT